MTNTPANDTNYMLARARRYMETGIALARQHMRTGDAARIDVLEAALRTMTIWSPEMFDTVLSAAGYHEVKRQRALLTVTYPASDRCRHVLAGLLEAHGGLAALATHIRTRDSGDDLHAIVKRFAHLSATDEATAAQREILKAALAFGEATGRSDSLRYIANIEAQERAA